MYIEILNQEMKRQLLNKTQKHKLKFVGHIIRQEGIRREILAGMMEGERRREDQESRGQTTSRHGWGK